MKNNVQEFKDIANDLGELYEKKNAAYGNSFGETYQKLGIGPVSKIRRRTRTKKIETMKLTEIFAEQAEQLYPLKENAECHVAYLQGARCAVKVYTTEIGERLIKAYESGEISKEVIFKLAEIIKS